MGSRGYFWPLAQLCAHQVQVLGTPTQDKTKLLALSPDRFGSAFDALIETGSLRVYRMFLYWQFAIVNIIPREKANWPAPVVAHSLQLLVDDLFPLVESLNFFEKLLVDTVLILLPLVYPTHPNTRVYYWSYSSDSHPFWLLIIIFRLLMTYHPRVATPSCNILVVPFLHQHVPVAKVICGS